ncbi:MAG: GNAT family N-acetyltransferase [Bryobacterales bacterium]|nr:GNAT family N-acetyltransferase [Bryobacterales bacterium]
MIDAVQTHLKQGEADIAHFEPLPLGSPLWLALRDQPGRWERDSVEDVQRHYLLDIPSTIDEIYRHMSGTRRKHLRRSLHQLHANPLGDPTLVCYRSIEDLPCMFQHCEEVARKTYQRGLRVGFADLAHIRTRLHMAATKGWLRGYVLYLGPQPCAFWIGMLYHGVFVSEYMGYDPSYRQWSPGMVLIMRVLERMCSQADGLDVRELDFGLGHAEYKAVLGTRCHDESSLYLFSSTFKGLSLKCMRTSHAVLDRCARQVLTSLKLLPALKRAWRDYLAERSHKGSHQFD